MIGEDVIITGWAGDADFKLDRPVPPIAEDAFAGILAERLYLHTGIDRNGEKAFAYSRETEFHVPAGSTAYRW